MREFADTAGLVLGVFGRADSSTIIALVTPPAGTGDPFLFADLGIWILQMFPYAMIVSLSLMVVVRLWLEGRQPLATGAMKLFLGQVLISRSCSHQPVTSAQ